MKRLRLLLADKGDYRDGEWTAEGDRWLRHFWDGSELRVDELADAIMDLISKETRDQETEIERLRAERDAIDALHQPIIVGACRQCNCTWPCQTHVLLHPKEARRG